MQLDFAIFVNGLFPFSSSSFFVFAFSLFRSLLYKGEMFGVIPYSNLLTTFTSLQFQVLVMVVIGSTTHVLVCLLISTIHVLLYMTISSIHVLSFPVDVSEKAVSTVYVLFVNYKFHCIRTISSYTFHCIRTATTIHYLACISFSQGNYGPLVV